MADTAHCGLLAVRFWHEGKVEATMVVGTNDSALTAAQLLLATRDALYSGDRLTVDAAPRPTLIERGLA
jgi:hypothetical protein